MLVIKKTKHVLALFGRTPGGDFPNFYASAHCGLTLIFQVHPNPFWLGSYNRKTLPRSLKWKQYRLLLAYNNKSEFSFVNSAVNMTLPEFAAERRAAAPLLLGARRCRSMFCPREAQQQTRCTPQRLSNDRTDGRTPDRYIDPAPRT